MSLIKEHRNIEAILEAIKREGKKGITGGWCRAAIERYSPRERESRG